MLERVEAFDEVIPTEVGETTRVSRSSCSRRVVGVELWSRGFLGSMRRICREHVIVLDDDERWGR